MVDNRYRVNAGSLHSLKCRLVWCPKYPKRILIDALEKRLRQLLYQKAKEIKAQIHTLEIMPDHVHMFVESDPTMAPARLAAQFKGFTSHHLREEFPWLKSYLPEFVEPFVLHRKRRRGLQDDSQAIHSEAKDPTVTTISCVGCGRTQRLRKNKVVPSDGYLCGVGYGKQNPKFALPRIPEGGVRRTVQNAAAGFSGYTTRFGTPEELAAVSRARGIPRRGRNQS